MPVEMDRRGKVIMPSRVSRHALLDKTEGMTRAPRPVANNPVNFVAESQRSLMPFQFDLQIRKHS